MTPSPDQAEGLEALREKIEAACICDCIDAYTRRGMAAPTCARHSNVDIDAIMEAVDAHYRPILEALIHKFECKLPGAMCDECDAAFRVYEASR